LGIVLSLERRVPRAAGAHQSRTYRRHEDARGSKLRPESLGKPHEGELARAVRHEMGNTQLATDGRDVDDATFSSGAHMWQYRQDDVEWTPEVRGHVALEVDGGHDADRSDLDHPGIVDQYIDGTVRGLHRPNQLCHLGAIGHVASLRQDVCACLREGLACAGKRVGVAAADRDTGAGESSLWRELEPEATRAAADPGEHA